MNEKEIHCFVIMPYDDAFVDVYSAIKTAVEVFAEGDGRFGFQVVDLRENGLAHFAFGHKPVGARHRAALFVMGLGVFAGSKFIRKGSMPTSRNAVKFSRRCSIS